MNRLIALCLLAALPASVPAQEKKDKESVQPLPTACEIRAYFLDKDDKACDATDVKATVVFDSSDGKTRSYPMAYTRPKEGREAAPDCRYFAVEKTDYHFGVYATCTDSSVPGGNTHYDKPFLKPLAVPLEPDPKSEPDKRSAALASCGYYRAYLNQQDIKDLAAGQYSDVSIVWTIRSENRKTKCYSCSSGSIEAPCNRISDDLRTLEKQVQADEMDQAKETLARIRTDVDALPAAAGNEKAKADCSACFKDLETAINAGKKDKALKEIHKLQAKCEACEANPSESKPSKK
ncbi:MAG TPA: hypothetical protein VE981_07265 [Planctomycetota bacterium]|nr:hypothetical protein [Planctomycetota bacterium]